MNPGEASKEAQVPSEERRLEDEEKEENQCKICTTEQSGERWRLGLNPLERPEVEQTVRSDRPNFPVATRTSS